MVLPDLMAPLEYLGKCELSFQWLATLTSLDIGNDKEDRPGHTTEPYRRLVVWAPELLDLSIVMIGKVTAAVGMSNLGSWLCYPNEVFKLHKETKLTHEECQGGWSEWSLRINSSAGCPANEVV